MQSFQKLIKSRILKMPFIKTIAFTILIVAAAGGLGIGLPLFFRSSHQVQSDTVELGFSNIGELSTQEAILKEIAVSDDRNSLFGMNIPFTEAKYIFGYIVHIKAGYDFSEITCDIDSSSKTITLSLPEVKILSTEIDEDSFTNYHEEGSVFNPYTPAKSNEVMSKIKTEAIQTAVENHLLENAEENAKTLLRATIAGNGNLQDYKIRFQTQAIHPEKYLEDQETK